MKSCLSRGVRWSTSVFTWCFGVTLCKELLNSFCCSLQAHAAASLVGQALLLDSHVLYRLWPTCNVGIILPACKYLHIWTVIFLSRCCISKNVTCKCWSEELGPAINLILDLVVEHQSIWYPLVKGLNFPRWLLLLMLCKGYGYFCALHSDIWLSIL